MTVTDKYWLQVNKKSFKYDIIAVVILSGFLGSMGPLSICYYMFRIITYSMRYLNIKALYSDDIEGLNQVLIMPFSREQIYKTYIKMMLCMAGIFTVIVGLSKLLSTLIGGQGNISRNDIILKPTFLNNVSYYLILFCILLILLINLVSKISYSTIQTKRLNNLSILLFLVSIVFSNLGFMLAVLDNPIAGYIYFILGLIGTVSLILLLVNGIRKNYKEFVVKFRRYVHVQ
jgi:hypothetical protein